MLTITPISFVAYVPHSPEFPSGEFQERETCLVWGVQAQDNDGYRWIYTGVVMDEAHAQRCAMLFNMQERQKRLVLKRWRETAPAYGSKAFIATDGSNHWLDDDDDREARCQRSGGWW
jgi:hypothetical protein